MSNVVRLSAVKDTSKLTKAIQFARRYVSDYGVKDALTLVDFAIAASRHGQDSSARAYLKEAIAECELRTAYEASEHLKMALNGVEPKFTTPVYQPAPPRPKVKPVTWGEFLAKHPIAMLMWDDHKDQEQHALGPREMLPYLAKAETDDDKLAVLALGVYALGWRRRLRLAAGPQWDIPTRHDLAITLSPPLLSLLREREKRRERRNMAAPTATPPKTITIGDFLTDREIEAALRLYTTDRDKFHKLCVERIIKPNIDRINAKLGQENDPDWLAFAVEFSMLSTVN